jgi:hypothetical protein
MVYCATFSDTMTAGGSPQPRIAAFPKSKDRFRNPRPPGITPGISQTHYGYFHMKPVLSFIVITVLLAAASRAGADDVTQGTILALDRKARLLVMQDRTIWSLELMKSEISASLAAGDRVEISYESDEEGVGEIKSIKLLPPKPPQVGAPDATDGTVLIYDRKAKRLVLTDRTVWDLDALKSALPSGLEAGSRVHIEYESDEEGVSAINSITLTLN